MVPAGVPPKVVVLVEDRTGAPPQVSQARFCPFDGEDKADVVSPPPRTAAGFADEPHATSPPTIQHAPTAVTITCWRLVRRTMHRVTRVRWENQGEDWIPITGLA